MATLKLNLPYDCSTLANFKLWAQGIGTALSTFGWVLQSVNGNVNWSTIPAVADYSPVLQNNYNFQGAWTNGNSYIGNSGPASAPCDLVTMAGGTYECIQSNTGSTGVNDPVTDTAHSFWKLVAYEVWKSGDSLSTTNPIYLRIQYVPHNSALAPEIHLQVCTAVSSAGSVTGTVFGAGTSTAGTRLLGTGSGLGDALFECDFSGDSGNFSMIMFRGAIIISNSIPNFFAVTRSKDHLGTDTDSYFTILTATNLFSCQSQTIMKPSLGSATILDPYWPTIVFSAPSAAFGGGMAALPVFPVVGYIGNPLLQAMVLKNSDIAEGALFSVTLYGATHTYLSSKPSASGNLNAVGGTGFGMLWE